ncbi:seryl-tRNA synthetase synthetase [Coccidioides immitis RMSCC 3703]|uniref:serine--tRNA ligase n=1 Tax=Coccidioides immitis RMSCC 3703 TaxID=454286 RepID=A0A0J8QL02_COCIT|nr:seryl-tRNA synthetase synthetase [Coccidioides immitis RMSCC 3703]
MTAPYICLNCRRTCLRALQFRRPFSSSPRILHDSNSSTITRPPTGPKPVPNVKHIRENAELYSQNCIDRNYRSLSEYPSRIKSLADEAAQLQRSLNAPRSKIKQVQRAIAKLATSSTEGKGKAPGKNEELDALHLEAKQLKDASQSMTDRREKCLEEVQQLALSLPNLTSKETPRGDIPRALVQYALSVAMRRGWKPVSPPTLVYSYIAEACGFQPRDVNNEQQIWSIEQNEKDKSKPQRCLTGTAEIPLAAMYAGQEIPADKLPLKFIGISRCYRAEAGARGVDTKGLYRVHEFTKVELFGWADDIPEANSKSATTTTTTTTSSSSSSSSTLFSEMLSIQTEILSSLNLPCRILEMPTADLGASAARKQDIETLFPSRLHHTLTQQPSQAESFDQNGWGEVTSASICTDYQSRRLGTRVRTGAAARFPSTVNGTAVAVPRVMAAILENGWDEKRGVVIVPEVLRNWMGGIETIGGREGMVE